MVNLLAQELVGDKAELSQLLETDPVAYIQARARFDEKQGRLFEAFRAADEFQKSQVTAANQPPSPEFVAEKQEQLLNLIPEWRDHNKQAQEAAMVAGVLRGAGYQDDEINAVYDPRAIVVARKAALFDQLQQAKAKKTQAPVAPVKPVKATAQSGDAPTNQSAKQAFQKLKRTGSLEDALAALNARDRN
ncbi:hypothetical protein FHW69_001600 [Luteibacter sp. Sphag1AF]|uniref:hypothetical protein n=1 Tax=Luteibacter sp. Sphag1AF TaxID=2587031 RepID=UPI00162062F4|nr:hypothetical protein [Luteibacter sp. Sphag1AF]MBB3226999.1 hypothetical protein [Luteibacter sp. Sphag1AF]